MKKLFEGCQKFASELWLGMEWRRRPFLIPAVIVREQVIWECLRARLRPRVAMHPDDAEWNIFTSKVPEELAPEWRFGSRVASVAEVTLRESAERDACWAESVESGWLF